MFENTLKTIFSSDEDEDEDEDELDNRKIVPYNEWHESCQACGKEIARVSSNCYFLQNS